MTITAQVSPDTWRQSLKYGPLQELALPAHGTRGNHADMGQVRQYLKEHDDEDVFGRIFAVGEGD